MDNQTLMIVLVVVFFFLGCKISCGGLLKENFACSPSRKSTCYECLRTQKCIINGEPENCESECVTPTENCYNYAVGQWDNRINMQCAQVSQQGQAQVSRACQMCRDRGYGGCTGACR